MQNIVSKFSLHGWALIGLVVFATLFTLGELAIKPYYLATESVLSVVLVAVVGTPTMIIGLALGVYLLMLVVKAAGTLLSALTRLTQQVTSFRSA